MTVPRCSIQELIVCAEREVKYRKRVYARRIQLLKMSEAKADREIAMMQADRGRAAQAGAQIDLMAKPREPKLMDALGQPLMRAVSAARIAAQNPALAQKASIETAEALEEVWAAYMALRKVVNSL